MVEADAVKVVIKEIMFYWQTYVQNNCENFFIFYLVSTWNIMAPTGKIFMVLCMEDF